MRVLPEYQGKGLGSMLLKSCLKQAQERRKRIFLHAGPESRALYEKFRFEVVGQLGMQMEKYGGRGTCNESLMIWDGGKKDEGNGEFEDESAWA